MKPRTGTRLDPILADVQRRADERRRRRSTGAPETQGTQGTPGSLETLGPVPQRRARFRTALAGPDLSLIAECKRRSPSAGVLGARGDVQDLGPRVQAYARGGASALSVLTESDHFRGSLADLAAAASADRPRLRKDFLLDAFMVEESVAAGADAVLLIAACLPGRQLADLRACARELGLFVLLEIHEASELERAIDVAPDAIGVNARDLRTFDVDLARVEALLPRLPDTVLRVAESGLHTDDDLRRVRDAGADAALIGTALMRDPDPEARLARWTEGVCRA